VFDNEVSKVWALFLDQYASLWPQIGDKSSLRMGQFVKYYVKRGLPQFSFSLRSMPQMVQKLIFNKIEWKTSWVWAVPSSGHSGVSKSLDLLSFNITSAILEHELRSPMWKSVSSSVNYLATGTSFPKRGTPYIHPTYGGEYWVASQLKIGCLGFKIKVMFSSICQRKWGCLPSA
jgi:hypothetical protein